MIFILLSIPAVLLVGFAIYKVVTNSNLWKD